MLQVILHGIFSSSDAKCCAYSLSACKYLMHNKKAYSCRQASESFLDQKVRGEDVMSCALWLDLHSAREIALSGRRTPHTVQVVLRWASKCRAHRVRWHAGQEAKNGGTRDRLATQRRPPFIFS